RESVVRGIACRSLRSLRTARGRGAELALSGRCRALRPDAMAAQRRGWTTGRRWRHVDDARAAVRKGWRAHSRGHRRVLAGFSRADSWGVRRSPLLGFRDFADRAYAQSARAGSAYEHTLYCYDKMVVRRRFGPDAAARRQANPARSGYGRLSCRNEGRVRFTFGCCAIRKIQDMVRRVLLSAAPQGAARRGRHLLRSPQFRRLESRFRLHAGRRTRLPDDLSRACTAQFWNALECGRSRGAADPTRALCRIQPALRPRHALRPQDRRQCRFDSFFAATG